MSRRPIRVMPSELAQLIAAGEVVERPASAVKELLDNALDAGATRIEVEVRDAGLHTLRVLDNGHGIPRQEVPLAFSAHATNKIGKVGDLEHIETLGFRGEALPSLAAVAHVEIETRWREEEVGTRYSVSFGEPGGLVPCVVHGGTRISVRDLFGNVPARRKFIRSQRAESGQIVSVLAQYALAQPAVRFSLTVDGRPVFSSPGTGGLCEVLGAVYTPSVTDSILTIDRQDRNVGVFGAISTPDLTRSNRAGIHVSVNGRPIVNRSLVFALEEAYSGYIMSGRHPLAVIHLTIPPEEIDVNVHPSKAEIRFERSREVHGTLHRVVAEALFDLRMQARGIDGEAPALIPGESASAEQAALELQGSEESTAPGGLPVLRVFGQTNSMFIVAEGPQGIYMIDQHAAHERILFDRLDAQIDRQDTVSQPLLEPAPVDLTPEQMGALEENGPLLQLLGFEVEPFGDSACLVRAVPAIAVKESPGETVGEVLTELQALKEPGAARERALAALACKSAVKAGQALDVQEMREIVLLLERTPRPATCPHGRPTMIHLSLSQLEREFGRR